MCLAGLQPRLCKPRPDPQGIKRYGLGQSYIYHCALSPYTLAVEVAFFLPLPQVSRARSRPTQRWSLMWSWWTSSERMQLPKGTQEGGRQASDCSRQKGRSVLRWIGQNWHYTPQHGVEGVFAFRQMGREGHLHCHRQASAATKRTEVQKEHTGLTAALLRGK